MTLLSLALAAWAYARGVRALWRRAGAGRGIRPWQAAAFAGGLLTLFLALVSPLDALSAALFSAHMVQHLALILVAAPLLVLGAPLLPFLWALPVPARQAIGGWWKRASVLRIGWRALGQPLVVWVLHTAVVWLWHLPGPFQAALASEPVHALEHASFLGTALLFWWTVIHPGARERLGYGPGVLYVFAMSVQSGALGALITFASTPWYPAYGESAPAWGLSPLEDQQLAGLIMWVPAGLVYLSAALVLLAAWLRAEEQAAQRGERPVEGPS
jgi:putative membrane protein